MVVRREFRRIRRLVRSRGNVPIVERRRHGDRARVGGRAKAAPRDAKHTPPNKLTEEYARRSGGDTYRTR